MSKEFLGLYSNVYFQAKKPRPPGNGHKITDWDTFGKFVSLHGDKTQASMAALWEDEISARTISRALQKIGFTRKKADAYAFGGAKPYALRSPGSYVAPSKDLRLSRTG